MLFSVPVHFNITATRIGGERKQSTQAWSMVDFEMTDMTDDDVPVVLRWKQDFKGIEFARSGFATAIGASPSNGIMHVRKFGGHFFKPVVIDGTNSIAMTRHGEDADFLTGQKASQLLASYDDTSIFATPLPGKTQQKRLRSHGGDGLADFESVERHDLERKIGNVRERLSKFMLVEGVLYERCPEPKVGVFTTEVQLDGTTSVQSGTFALVTTNPHSLTALDKNAVFFELEDYDTAIEKVSRANKSRTRREELGIANSRMAPEIAQTESIYGQDVAWMRRATRIALNVTAWIGDLRGRELSEELFSAYRKLHKCLHMSDGDERFVLMSEAMADIVVACRGPEWQPLADAADAGLEILDSRPIALALDRGLRMSPA
jgi:hypothetical protein